MGYLDTCQIFLILAFYPMRFYFRAYSAQIVYLSTFMVSLQELKSLFSYIQ